MTHDTITALAATLTDVLSATVRAYQPAGLDPRAAEGRAEVYARAIDLKRHGVGCGEAERRAKEEWTTRMLAEAVAEGHEIDRLIGEGCPHG